MFPVFRLRTILEGMLWRQQNFQKKVAQCLNKLTGGTLQTCPALQMHEKVARIRNRTNPQPLGSSESIKVCTKKWNKHGEVCGLAKQN